MIAQPDGPGQVQRGGVVIRETVGTCLQYEAVAANGVDGAADTGSLFQNNDLRGGECLLQTVGKCQPRNAGTNDDNSWHGPINLPWTSFRSRWHRPLPMTSSRLRRRPTICASASRFRNALSAIQLPRGDAVWRASS